MRLVPPLGFLTKKEGLTCSPVIPASSGLTMMPLDSGASNLSCNLTSLLWAYWGRWYLRWGDANVFCCTQWAESAIVTTNLRLNTL